MSYPPGTTQAMHDEYFGRDDGECPRCGQKPCECEEMTDQRPLSETWMQDHCIKIFPDGTRLNKPDVLTRKIRALEAQLAEAKEHSNRMYGFAEIYRKFKLSYQKAYHDQRQRAEAAEGKLERAIAKAESLKHKIIPLSVLQGLHAEIARLRKALPAYNTPPEEG